MRVVFMGTPAFAVPTLRALEAAGHEVAAVYTRADSVSGRGKKLLPSDVKVAAEELGLEVRTPASLRDGDEQEALRRLAPDAIVVAAYGLILPREVIEIPRLGCFNVHGSSLPRWRGAAPVQRAILAGDETAGVCIMKMDEGLDTGDYHSCGTVELGVMHCDEVEAQLAQLGADGMAAALPAIEAGTYEWLKQDESLVTYAEKISKEEILLTTSIAPSEFHRRVRAATDSAPARCIICGKTVQVVDCKRVDGNMEPGEVKILKNRILLGADCDERIRVIELLKVKPQGKGVMDASQWVNGIRNAEPVWKGL